MSNLKINDLYDHTLQTKQLSITFKNNGLSSALLNVYFAVGDENRLIILIKKEDRNKVSEKARVQIITSKKEPRMIVLDVNARLIQIVQQKSKAREIFDAKFPKKKNLNLKEKSFFMELVEDAR